MLRPADAIGRHATALRRRKERLGREDLEAIAAVPGVDLVFLGDGDLAMDMGFPSQRDHPAVREVVARTLGRARQLGVRIGMFAATPDAAVAVRQEGVCWLVTTTAALYGRAARDFLRAARG